MSWEADPRIIEEKQDLEKLIQNEVKQEDPKKHYKEISKRYSPWHAFNLCRELYGDKSNFI